MNWADWAIVAIVLISGLLSLRRGFVKEALSLLVWLLAFAVAMLFREPMQLVLEAWIATPSLRAIAAFAILFIATLVVGGLVSSIVGQLVKVTGLTGTDRYLGFCFGLLRGVMVVIAGLIMIPALAPIDQDLWWQQSVLIPELLKLEPVANDLVTAVRKLVAGWIS